MSTQAHTSRPEKLARRSREALYTLALQFLLGMAANLIGSPEENTGAAVAFAGIVLALHALVGIGLIVVAVRVWMAARSAGAGARSALWAFIVIIATFLIGIGTMMTGNGWLSFLMSVGFVAAAALYVRIDASALGRRRASATH
ncbi:hypothetical protein GCM10028798_31800 [Humibacter antri]